MNPINKNGILYRGVRRGRRKLLAICLAVAAITVWYTVAHMTTLVGKFHGPYEFDYAHFAANTQTETFTEPIKMKKREDRSVNGYAHMATSYTKDGAYRFNVTFEQVELTDVHYDTTYEDPKTKEPITMVTMQLYLGRIGESLIPVMMPGNRELHAGDTVTGIFVEPAKVIRSDLAATVPEGESLTVSSYMLDTRGLEMGTENSDPWIIAILLLLTLFLAIRVGRYYVRPLCHPTYTQLQKYGELNEVIASVEEQAVSDDAYTEDKRLVMPDWIASDSTFMLQVTKNHMATGRYE